VTELARGDSLQLDDQVVEPAWPGKSRLERRIEDTPTVFEKPQGVLLREGLQKALGRHASPSLKDSLKVGRTETNVPGDFGQRRLLETVLLEPGKCLSHPGIIRRRRLHGTHSVLIALQSVKNHPILAPVGWHPLKSGEGMNRRLGGTPPGRAC
jgi:hypothetical protein